MCAWCESKDSHGNVHAQGQAIEGRQVHPQGEGKHANIFPAPSPSGSELGAFICMFSFNLHNRFEKLYFNTLALQGRKLRLRKMMSPAGIH